jgi:aspartate aminotransferase
MDIRKRARTGAHRVRNLASRLLPKVLPFSIMTTFRVRFWTRYPLPILLAAVFLTVYSFSIPDTVPAALDVWKDVDMAPPDAILGIAQAFRESKDPRKVNLCVGAYRDEEGQPWVLPSVRQAEKRMLENNVDKEYLPIDGDPAFIQRAVQFAYGEDVDLDKIAAVQTLSGTGACRLGGALLAQTCPDKTIYIPTPTWGNHWKIFKACGLKSAPYRYYSRSTNGLDFAGLLEDLSDAPDESIILLHACAHNPTGCDPSEKEWQDIIDVLQRKHHICFFDSAYQGFATGNAEHDALAFRRVVARGLPVLLAQSFAKNFGLYGERCGTLSVVCRDRNQRDRVVSQLKGIIRPMYSSPPRHGSSIVATVLSDSDMKNHYIEECTHMAERIKTMRSKLVETLKEVGSQHDWSHITKQIGMFAFTGMSEDMVDELTANYAMYMTRDGRISLAGLNEHNLDYVARAIHKVTDGKSITQDKESR